MLLFRWFVRVNLFVSRAIDRMLPGRLRSDGNKSFLARTRLRIQGHSGTLYDLGGGSRPFMSPEEKRLWRFRVVGLDISASELAAAPKGSYDAVVAEDLCTYRGQGDGDVVICQSTLEHVFDSEGAIRAISSCLAANGVAYLFVPCRNALYARLNLALPQQVKERLLFAVFPEKASGHEGFPARYDMATPTDYERMCERHGLDVEEMSTYWVSSYFFALTPAYLVWRLYQALAYLAIGRDAAESFALVLRKREGTELGA